MMPEITMPTTLAKLKDYFVESLSPLLDSRVIQVLLVRQTHDFTVLRTEESRELNTVVLPRSIDLTDPVVKVAFLASKQKAVENRMFSRMLRTVRTSDCELKDKLCMSCPRCVLFGAVQTEGGGEFNIKHRIEYSTAFSVEPYEDLLESITFNAVTESTQKTDQALNLTYNVKPLANFPSVITLSSVTWQELVMYLKALLASKSYGAESRIKGDVRNTVLGIVGGYEEIITSLEYNLELAAKWDGDLEKTTHDLLLKYAKMAASRRNVTVLSTEDTRQLMGEIQDMSLSEGFVSSMYDQAQAFVSSIKTEKKAAGKKGKQRT